MQDLNGKTMKPSTDTIVSEARKPLRNAFPIINLPEPGPKQPQVEAMVVQMREWAVADGSQHAGALSLMSENPIARPESPGAGPEWSTRRVRLKIWSGPRVTGCAAPTPREDALLPVSNYL